MLVCFLHTSAWSSADFCINWEKELQETEDHVKYLFGYLKAHKGHFDVLFLLLLHPELRYFFIGFVSLAAQVLAHHPLPFGGSTLLYHSLPVSVSGPCKFAYFNYTGHASTD